MDKTFQKLFSNLYCDDWDFQTMLSKFTPKKEKNSTPEGVILEKVKYLLPDTEFGPKMIFWGRYSHILPKKSVSREFCFSTPYTQTHPTPPTPHQTSP